MGKPKIIDKFTLYNIDGVDVYVAQTIRPHESGINIYLKKFLWVKDLTADGIYLK